MSTIRVVNIQHSDATEPNIVLNADGTATFVSGITISGGTNLTVSGTAEFASGTVSAPGITFIDDNNTGIYEPAADTVAITTSGTERLRVDSSGRLGIGTSSPSSLLHLSVPTAASDGTKGVRITNPAGTAAMFECGSSNDSYIGTTSVSDFSIRTNNTSRIYVTNGGNVGIGTTSPLQPLHVSSGDNNDSGEISIAIGGTIANGRTALITKDTSTPYDLKIRSSQDASFNTAIAFETRTNNERMRIDSSGRLLVGTSTSRNIGLSTSYPSTLQLETTNYAAASFVNNSNDVQPAYLTLGKSRGGIGSNTIVQSGDVIGHIGFAGADGTDVETLAAHIQCYVDGTPGSNDMPGRLVFSTTADGASSPTERMRINSAGGIYFGASSDYGITNYAQTTGNGNFYYKPDSGTQAGSIVATNNSDRGWALAYLNKFAWNSGDDGRWIAFYLNGSVQDSISWTGSAISYGTSSDYRRKTNVSTYTGGLEKVKQLHVREYDWIEFPDANRSVGFFAHELQEIFPQAVTGVKDGMKTDEFTGEQVPDYQGIDYGKITPLLAAALQEAIAKIETLEQRLSDAGIA